MSRENSAIKELSKNKNITFCKADKGGALLILNKIDYETLVMTHLNDTSTYLPFETCQDSFILEKIKNLVLSFEQCFMQTEKNFLFNFVPKTSYFYVLPKIHKSDDVINLCSNLQNEFVDIKVLPQPMPSRPIISNVNSPTSHLSYFIDKLLLPFVSVVDGYIKDTFDFLNKLPRSLPCESYFVTLDVCNLYTIIPKDFGLFSVQFWFQKFPHLLDKRFSLQFILSALDIILSNNTFHFKNKHFKQINGTAMGTCVAPKYAHLTMGYLEVLLKKKCLEEFGEEKTNSFFQFYFRFLDDIFLITDLSFSDIERFILIFNNFHQSFKFTSNINLYFANFLDVQVSQTNNIISTDIFHKATDSFQYLHFSSQHPSHIKRNIPYTLAKRIQHIVSNPHTKDIRFFELRCRLLKLKYPEKLINDAISKAVSITQTPNNSQHKKHVYFSYTHSKENTQLVNDKLQPFFTYFNSFLPESNLFVKRCLRNNFNLKSLLCTNSHLFSVKKCNESRCKTCSILVEGNCSTLVNNKPIYFNSNMSCKTPNVIYILFCSCKKFYVGQTSCILRLRVNLHRQQINNPLYSFLFVSKHIHNCGNNFNVMPIYYLKNASSYVVNKMENYFIWYLKPTLNVSPVNSII